MSASLKNKSSTSVINMTEGSPYKHILAFALPFLLSQVFQQLYNTADMFIVGRYLGTEALAAVSSSGMLITLLTNFFVGAALGAGVVISKYFGAGDACNVSRSIHSILAFGLITGVMLTIVGITLTPTFLVWMNTNPDVLPLAIEYFRYYFFGVLATVMYNLCKSILNALGDSRRPLYYLIISSLLNISLDILFVGVFHWGVGSAAVATVISQFVSFVLCFINLLKKNEVYTVEIRKIRLHMDMLKEILRYGLPSGIQNCVICLANVIIQSYVNAFGTYAMAAFGTHNKLQGLAFMPIMSFNMATTTFIGQNLGAKKYDRARIGARFGIIAPMVLAELIGLAFYIWAPQLISLFDSTPGVVELGVLHTRIICFSFFALAFSHSVASVCRGAGKAFVPMAIMLVVWCLIRIVYIIIVMRLFNDIKYIYWAYPITWGISSVIYLFYYLFSDWIHGFEKPSRLKRT